MNNKEKAKQDLIDLARAQKLEVNPEEVITEPDSAKKNLIQKLWSNQGLRNLFLYLIVGGLATIVEWVCFWAFDSKLHIHYMVATALAFVVSTFANWLFGRLLVFKKQKDMSLGKELAAIYATSVGGLLFNLAIMYVLVEWVKIGNMAAKIIATIIVFAYNYLIRKLLIYKEK